MPAFASLVLANAAAVNTTFWPTRIDSDGVARWSTNSESVFDMRRIVTQQVTLPKNGSSVIRVREKILLPVADTVNTSLVVGSGYANVEFVMSKLMTAVERDNLIAFTYASLAAGSAMRTAVAAFEASY